jgi:hypothetical protein
MMRNEKGLEMRRVAGQLHRGIIKLFLYGAIGAMTGTS